MQEEKEMLPDKGSSVYIQSFKHDGSLHRTWCKGFIIDADEERIVAVTNKAWVIEANGRRWFTREPAVCFLYQHQWFNVISMIRKSGIYYYCNLATPSIYDGEAIKNIDYDLDVKLYPDGMYEILDEDEFKLHAEQMHYSKEIIEVVRNQMDILIHRMDEGKEPFNTECVESYYDEYIRMNR